MKAISIALLAALCASAASADTPAADFDQGVDVSAALESAKEAAQDADVEGTKITPKFRREERDCANVSFRPEDPLTSERIRLESRMYEEVCYPDPHIPRDRYPRKDSGEKRNCHERWVRTETRHVRVSISGRGEMLPWERDVFQVCLQGNWLTAYVLDASHKYDLDVPGWHGDTVEARALRKTPADPDPIGISEGSFGYDASAAGLVLELGDRWAQYYDGEKVALELVLKRYRKNWFDGTVLDKTVELPVAAAYSVNFADYAGELSGDLDPGKEYYVKWRFKRIGQVSKDTWTKYRESARAKYEGAKVPASKEAPVEIASAGEKLGMNTCSFMGLQDGQCFYACRNGKEYKIPLPPGMESMGSRACLQVYNPTH